jgi:sugar/nucleoside kinase (ribokinase family)
MMAPALGAFGVGIVTRVGADFEPKYINDLKSSGLDISGLRPAGLKSTRFVNQYNQEGVRTQRLEALAPEIRAMDFLPKHLDANIVHFTPLMQEVHPSCIEVVKSRGALVSLDVQGFTRTVEGTDVVAADWVESDDVLRYVDVVKCDKRELDHVTGMQSETGSATHILSLGPRILVVTKEQTGSTIHTRSGTIDIPLVLADKLVDTTGCGDTYIIGFLLEYMRTGDVKRAGLFGATCASFNLETVGPYDYPTRTAVEARFAKYLH